MENNFNQGISDYGKTEPVTNANFGGDYGKTEPNTGAYGDFGGTDMGGVPNWGNAFDRTAEAPNAFTGGYTPTEGGFQPETYNVTEPITPNNEHNFLPVVGWFVCIEGPDRGRDYRIRDGYNTIGRDPGNDICITGDMNITRDRHAVVGFDAQENLFFISPDKGKNLIRVNGKVLMMPSELHSNDVVTIGSSKLLFIPLCSENFSWEKRN